MGEGVQIDFLILNFSESQQGPSLWLYKMIYNQNQGMLAKTMESGMMV